MSFSWVLGPRSSSVSINEETARGAGEGCRGCIAEGRREKTGVPIVGGQNTGECADCGEKGFKLDWQHTCRGRRQCPECREKPPTLLETSGT